MRAALRAFGRVFPGNDYFVAILAVPDRDAVTPPQLPADTPVLDIIHPVQENLGEAIRHKVDLALAHRFSCHFCQAVHLYEPLR